MAKNPRKMAALVLAACILLTAALAGCGKSDTGSTKSATQTASTQTQEATKVEEPYQFSIFRSTWTELNDETDPVIQELNKKLNVKIKVLTSPWETWVDKYNVLMSSGETPDISVVAGPGAYGYNQWVEQGKYLDITDIFPKYANILQKVPKAAFDAIKIKGKVYCIPKPYVYEDGMIFRADWLKKLGLSIPKTIDELYTVLKAFKENDPDGNGKADTYGLLSDDSMYNLMYFFGAFGAYGAPYDSYIWYKSDDGKIASTLTQPGMKDAIRFLSKLYKEKILDQEWMMTKSEAYFDKFKAGKGGCMTSAISQMYAMEADMKKVDPNISLDATTKITGPDGKFGKDLMLSYYMTCSISSQAKKPEKLLEFIDYMLSDEGITLLRYGIEGMTYKKEDGKIVVDEEASKKYGVLGGHKFTMMMSPADWNFPDDERGNKYKEACKWFLDQQPALPSLELPSQKEILAKQGADMAQKQIIAMIIGKVDVDKEWDNLIKKWKETGGDQLTKEMNEAYNNR